MYTANTMASAIESLGMSLPYSSSTPATSEEKIRECKNAGNAILNLLEKDIKPRDIMTRKAFLNAIVVTIALGGSTNAVLHLIAMAKSVGVKLTIDDFQTVSDRVPIYRGLEAERKICDGGPPGNRRSPGASKNASQRETAPRELSHRDWQNAR